MKHAMKLCLIITVLILTVQTGAFGSEDTPKEIPVAEFISPVYKFEATLEGLEVVHDYIVKNTGTAPLDIQKVKTG